MLAASSVPSSGSRKTAVLRAVRTALGCAAVLSAFVTLQSALTHGRALERYGLRLWEVIALYFGGAVVAGLVVGLLKPLTRTLLGAMIVGVVAVYPALLALSPIGLPDRPWTARFTGSLLLASVMGPVYAWALWQRPSR